MSAAHTQKRRAADPISTDHAKRVKPLDEEEREHGLSNLFVSLKVHRGSKTYLKDDGQLVAIEHAHHQSSPVDERSDDVGAPGCPPTLKTCTQPTPFFIADPCIPQQFSEGVDEFLARRGLRRTKAVEDYQRDIVVRQEQERTQTPVQHAKPNGGVVRKDMHSEVQSREALFRSATPTVDDTDDDIVQFALGEVVSPRQGGKINHEVTSGGAQPSGHIHLNKSPDSQTNRNTNLQDNGNSHSNGNSNYQDILETLSSSASPALREVTDKEMEIQSFGQRQRGGSSTASDVGRLWLREEIKFFRKSMFLYGEDDWDSMKKRMNNRFKHSDSWSIPLMKSRWVLEKTAMIAILSNLKFDKKSNRGEPIDEVVPTNETTNDLMTIAAPCLIKWVCFHGSDKGEWDEKKYHDWTRASWYLSDRFDELGKKFPGQFCDQMKTVDPRLVWEFWVSLKDMLINAPVLDVEDPDLHSGKYDKDSWPA